MCIERKRRRKHYQKNKKKSRRAQEGTVWSERKRRTHRGTAEQGPSTLLAEQRLGMADSLDSAWSKRLFCFNRGLSVAAKFPSFGFCRFSLSCCQALASASLSLCAKQPTCADQFALGTCFLPIPLSVLLFSLVQDFLSLCSFHCGSRRPVIIRDNVEDVPRRRGRRC